MTCLREGELAPASGDWVLFPVLHLTQYMPLGKSLSLFVLWSLGMKSANCIMWIWTLVASGIKIQGSQVSVWAQTDGRRMTTGPQKYPWASNSAKGQATSVPLGICPVACGVNSSTCIFPEKRKNCFDLPVCISCLLRVPTPLYFPRRDAHYWLLLFAWSLASWTGSFSREWIMSASCNIVPSVSSTCLANRRYARNICWRDEFNRNRVSHFCITEVAHFLAKMWWDLINPISPQPRCDVIMKVGLRPSAVTHTDIFISKKI